MRIIGIAGSLREKSFNRVLLRHAVNYLPDNSSLEIFDLRRIPLYNEDIIQTALPDSVICFRDEINDSDAILIASPEYNYSITGVLKNALDWATTNTLGNLLVRKPIAIMGASIGAWGTTRSQLHLRQVLHAANAKVIARPEIYISNAKSVFDENGFLSDEKILKRMRDLMQALCN